MPKVTKSRSKTSTYTLNELQFRIPYSLDWMPQLLFISLHNFVQLLFESGIY